VICSTVKGMRLRFGAALGDVRAQELERVALVALVLADLVADAHRDGQDRECRCAQVIAGRSHAESTTKTDRMGSPVEP
jgi:hypothetical protein